MLDRGHHVCLRGAVARQLVRDHDTRGPHLPLQQLAEQALGGPLVAPALNQNVEQDPILVDGPPEPMLLSADHQAHFVEMPLVARTGQPAPDLVGEALAELARPLAHGLMAHVNAAGRQHLLHHAQAQRKAEVEPHGVADDLAWKAVAGVGGLGGGCHAGHLPISASPAKPRPKLTVPSDLFGLAISEGALANILHDSAPAFETQASAIKRRLLSGTVLQSDETSARVGKRTFWTWVFHHADSACFVTAANRGKKVVEAFLGDRRPDVWVSDRLSAQMGWAKVDHQVCLAHLIRDVQYAIDAGDAAFAPGVMGLLKRAVGIGRRRQTLANSTLVHYHSRLQKRLDTLLAITPMTAAGQKLQRIIKRFRPNLFVFITHRAVPTTNNGSEQALRPCVVFRKVTNCFRSEWGASLYANVRSVVETARRRDIPILQAIRLTLDARLLSDGT